MYASVDVHVHALVVVYGAPWHVLCSKEYRKAASPDFIFACPNNDARGGRLARVASVGLLAGAVGLALAIQGTH